MRIVSLRCAAIAAALFIGGTAGTNAADLRVMFAGASPTLDPHFSYIPSFRPLRTAVFEGLTTFDKDGRPAGLLAESFRAVDDTTWEFKLRQGVVYSDGTPMVAEDVPFSVNRVATLKGGPSSLAQYVSSIKEVNIVDERTIQMKLSRTNPFLWYDLTMVQILSKKRTEGADPAQFITDFAKYAVGTGPYKVTSFAANSDFSLERNERYWGAKPEWDKVTARISPIDATRVAALLAGDADAIENVPNNDMDRLRADPRVTLNIIKTNGVAWFQLPGSEKSLKSGTITDPDGKPLDKNPLADKRVREAMLLSINVDAITERIYRGMAVSSGQYVRLENPEAVPEVKGWTFDEAKAKALMDESGWTNKFRIVLMTTATTFPESQKVLEAMAQSWAKIGVKTEVQVLTSPVYFQKRAANETSAVVLNFVPSAPDGEQYIFNLLNTLQPEIGRGFFNIYDYKNERIDELVKQFMNLNDEAKRIPLAIEAMRLGLADRTVIPLWHFSVAHGTKKGLAIVPRSSGSGFRVQDVVTQK